MSTSPLALFLIIMQNVVLQPLQQFDFKKNLKLLIPNAFLIKYE